MAVKQLHNASHAQSIGRMLVDRGVMCLIPAWPHTFVEVDNQIFSTVILLLQLINEGLLSVTVNSCDHVEIVSKLYHSFPEQA